MQEKLYRVDIVNSESREAEYTFKKEYTRQAAYVLYTYLTNLGESIEVYETAEGIYLDNPKEELLHG